MMIAIAMAPGSLTGGSAATRQRDMTLGWLLDGRGVRDGHSRHRPATPTRPAARSAAVTRSSVVAEPAGATLRSAEIASAIV